MSWDVYRDLDTLIDLCHTIVSLQVHTLNHLDRSEGETMATQQQVRQDIATLHTTLTSAVASVQAFQRAEADKIDALQKQLADLAGKAAAADIPDDIEQSIVDANDLASNISTQMLDPNQPPVQPTPGPDVNPAPAPTDPSQPPPTPTPGPSGEPTTDPTNAVNPGDPGTAPTPTAATG
jgi:hypothetical protein